MTPSHHRLLGKSDFDFCHAAVSKLQVLSMICSLHATRLTSLATMHQALLQPYLHGLQYALVFPTSSVI
jgi:hypothetical protein